MCNGWYDCDDFFFVLSELETLYNLDHCAAICALQFRCLFEHSAAWFDVYNIFIWLPYGVTRHTAVSFLKFWLSVHCYVLTEIANWNTGGGDVREVAFYSCRPYFDFIVTIRRWRSVASMWLCFHISNGNTASMVLHLNHSVANLTSIQEAYWFERQNRLYIVIVHYIPFF